MQQKKAALLVSWDAHFKDHLVLVFFREHFTDSDFVRPVQDESMLPKKFKKKKECACKFVSRDMLYEAFYFEITVGIWPLPVP